MRIPGCILKIVNYEYWPWWLFYMPLYPYLLWLMLKSGKVSFFTAVNPFIKMGGIKGESKHKILKKIPEKYLPKTLYIEAGSEIIKVLKILQYSEIGYPLIAKPDVGERGKGIKKIHSEVELTEYASASHVDFLIQEYVDLPLELGIFFIRTPGKTTGTVSSLTQKDFFTVVGDGIHTFAALVGQQKRGHIQYSTICENLGTKAQEVPEKDTIHTVEPIGNHCRGTRFINANHLINEDLHKVLSTISAQITGFDYGRFDLKVASTEDLYKGENIRILELNGITSEPAHVYDQSTGLLSAWRDIASHWNMLYLLSKENRKRGIQVTPLADLIRLLRS